MWTTCNEMNVFYEWLVIPNIIFFHVTFPFYVRKLREFHLDEYLN